MTQLTHLFRPFAKSVALALALLAAPVARAQDAQYSQFYAASVYHNPAFAGSERLHRISLNFRNQWPSIPGSYLTFAGTWDAWAPNLRSGYGVMVTHDVAGVAALRSTSINGFYAYHLPLGKQWKLSAGGMLGVVNRDLDYFNLTFADQLQSENSSPATIDPAQKRSNSRFYPDVSLGGLLYSRWSFVGGSVAHVNQPNQSLQLGSTEQLPMRLTANAGFIIPLDGKRRYKKNEPMRHVLYPSFMYRSQGPYDQFDAGTYLQLEPLLLGAFYRGLPIKKNFAGLFNQDVLSFMVGFYLEGFRLGYSYDYSLNAVVPGAAGSHELSLQFLIPGKEKEQYRNYGALPCPKF